MFEGGEGCGKSTQAGLLASRLGCVLTQQPGGTPIGARLRELLLDPETGDLDPRTEALLMAADRAQHVAELIEPTLTAGTHVVCDRYGGSSVAYQGYGRGLDPDEVGRLSEWATGGLRPDLVLLLVVPAETANERLGTERDRFEAADAQFHRRVAEGFAKQAEADPDRWVVIDGAGSVADVAARVSAVVTSRLDVGSLTDE